MSNGMNWTEERYAAHLKKQGATAVKEKAPAKAKAKSKYNATQTVVDNIKFGSKLEARRYVELQMEWKSVRARQLREGAYWKRGDLLWFTRQVVFVLEGGVEYWADFEEVRFWDETINVVTYVDTKGQLLPSTKNKLKQVKARYGIDVRIMTDDEVLKVSL